MWTTLDMKVKGLKRSNAVDRTPLPACGDKSGSRQKMTGAK